MNKICNKCKNNLPVTNFCKNSKTKDRLNPICRNCKKEINILNKDKNKEYYVKYYELNRDYLINKSKQWNQDNSEKFKERNKIHSKTKYLENRQEILERNKKWKSENRNKVNLRQREYLNENPDAKIASNLRNRLYNLLRQQNATKTSSALVILGCSVQECRKYLESQFKPEMSWENYGEVWEIDHIVPCNSFDLNKIEDQQKCFHYTNLQPLFKTTEIAESFGYKGYIGNRDKSDK